MKTEELELSLRTEFENYLKSVISEMRQETAEFQNKIQSEFDKQKSSFDEAFSAFSARFESETEFDEAFTSSVSEHMRLARDEGAKITAEAFAEAEKLEKENAVPAAAAKYDAIRDAVNDIAGKDSQATILKALVDHAAEFAPRGAFFIIKSEQFTGWRVFGDDTHAAEAAIREISFPMSADTVVGASVRSMMTIDSAAGAHPEDTAFLDDLGFGRPDRMYAIPLVARGKAVAVLYADFGNAGTHLQVQALETLVRVAGMTVELIAAQPARHETQPVGVAETEQVHHVEKPTPVVEGRVEEFYEPTPAVAFSEPMPAVETFQEPTPTFEPEPTTSEFAFSDTGSFTSDFKSYEPEPVPEQVYDPVQEVVAEPEVEHIYEPVASFEEVTAVEEAVTGAEPEAVSQMQFETVEKQFETVSEFVAETQAEVVEEPVSEFQPEVADFQPDLIDEPVNDFAPSGSPFEATIDEVAPAISSNGGFDVAPAVEVAAPVATASGTRLSDRNVDLPIEVAEDERRSHNDARRFARLLVSEIKLYNEKKVVEGRESADLYPRLREAIDRSREMYDKRVQPPVASKFDYFHYELVNSLAEGDADRLGSGYPGATV
ncbi:MAG: hypothetical protein WBD16_06550 [Pyrinomonadaceae bacterium]